MHGSHTFLPPVGSRETSGSLPSSRSAWRCKDAPTDQIHTSIRRQRHTSSSDRWNVRMRARDGGRLMPMRSDPRLPARLREPGIRSAPEPASCSSTIRIRVPRSDACRHRRPTMPPLPEARSPEPMPEVDSHPARTARRHAGRGNDRRAGLEFPGKVPKQEDARSAVGGRCTTTANPAASQLRAGAYPPLRCRPGCCQSDSLRRIAPMMAGGPDRTRSPEQDLACAPSSSTKFQREDGIR